MFGNRYVNLGSAQASVTIDTSQAQQSVTAMRSIAQQITQIVNSINQNIASVSNQAVSRGDIKKIVSEAIDLAKQQQSIQQSITQSVQETAQAQAQQVQAVREVAQAQKQQVESVQSLTAAQQELQQIALQRINSENQILSTIRAQIEMMNTQRSLAQNVRLPLLGSGINSSAPRLPSGMENISDQLSSTLALTEDRSAAEEGINSIVAQRSELEIQISNAMSQQLDFARQMAIEISNATQTRQALPGEYSVTKPPPAALPSGQLALPSGQLALSDQNQVAQSQAAASAAQATAAAQQQVTQATQATAAAQAVVNPLYGQAQQFTVGLINAQQQVTQAVQATTSASQQNTNSFEQQFAIANAMIGALRAQVAEQAQLYRTSAANAPATVDRSGVEQQLSAARQPIVELQAQLKQLRVEYLQATSPQEQAALVPQLQAIHQSAIQASVGIDAAKVAVSNFSQQVVSSRSGVDGYFNSVRENLEKINETSLAANLQEISFRLLPLGIAAAGLTKQGLETAEAIQESAISFTAFTGSQEKARQLMGELTDQAHKFGQPMIETLTTMQRFAPLIRNAGLQLSDVYNLAVRLSTLNPTQGIEGALFALNEALAGQWRSLQTRFNLPTKQLQEFVQQLGFTGGIDKFLNSLGRTTAFAEQFGQTTRAAFTRTQDAINNFLSTSMDKFLGGMQSGADIATNFFNSLANGNSILTTITGGLLLLTSTLTTGLITLGQFALAWTSIGAVAKPFSDPNTSAGQFAAQVAGSLSNTIPASVMSAFTSIAGALSALIAAAVRVGIEVGTTSANVFRGAASKVAEAVGNASTSIASGIAAAIPASVISAFVSAKVAIASSLSSIVAGAVALIVPLLTGAVVTTVALAIGGAIGIGISQHLVNILKVGTPTYREQLWQDPIGTLVDTVKKDLFLLASALTVGVAALRTAFAPVTVVLEQARDMLSAAVGKLSESIRTAGENLILNIINFVQGLGGAFSNVGNESKQAIESRRSAPSRFDLTDPGFPGEVAMSLPYAGLESGTKEQVRALAEIQKMFPAWTAEFVEGYKEQNDRLDKVLARGFFADPGRLSELNKGIAQEGVDFLKNLFAQWWPKADTGGDNGGGAPPVDQQAMDDALKIINQIAKAEQDYALQQKRTLEDRALAAAREVADVNLANQRRAEDFTLQQGRALDDYYRSRQQSIDDFNRQTVDAQKQSDEQRAKMQTDYNTQTLRAEQDHLRDMIRLSRNITDAISARDFLSAQKTVQQMQDQEADYQTEKARRDEDFQKQLTDLQDNLVKQQTKRKEDFDRQLALQEANFNLQRQRQVADYNRQAALAEQDRQLRLARQAQDFAIQDQRRAIDFDRQIQDMVNGNAILRGIWNNGLENILALTRGFFNQLPGTFSSGFSSIGALANSIGSIIGSVLGGSGGGTTDLGTGTPFRNAGTAFFDKGTWFVPSTMRATVHQGEIIIPPGPSDSIRRGQASIGAVGGNTYQVSVPLQVINGAGLNENQLVDRVEKVIIPKISEALEQQARTTQPRRGFN